MKILMTADTVGGVWNYALELIGALEDVGVEVALATMGRRLRDDQRVELGALGNVELYESEFRLEWMDEPWADLERAGEWLLGIADRVGPDLVHLNGYVHGALEWGCPVIVVGHSCVLSWWRAVRDGPAPNSWDGYRRAVREGIKGADLVIAPTATMLGSLIEFYGPIEASWVIPNGRDPAHFEPRGKEQLIFGAGRLWDEAKGLDLLAELAAGLAWPVYLAGATDAREGEDRDEVVGEGVARTIGIVGPDTERMGAKGAQLLGRLPARGIAEWVGRASIYAHPAHYEPFGLSALEAGLAGCALVLGDIPSLREVWGDAALFVPPGEYEPLREALEVLIDDDTFRRRLAALARERALEYSSERLGRRYRAAYTEAGRRWAQRTDVREISCA